MPKPAAALPILLLLLTGCASTTAGRGTIAATAGGRTAASARPSPTPTAMTLAQARTAYQDMVRPSNDAAHQVNVALHSYLANPTDARFLALKAATARLVTADEAYLSGLRGGLWPAAVQPAVDALVAALGPEIDGVRRLAEAADPVGYGHAQAAAKDANSRASAKAEVLRGKLDLSEVPDVSSSAGS